MSRLLFPIFLLLLLLLHSGYVSAQVCNGVWGAPLVYTTFGQGDATQDWYSPLASYAPGMTSNTIFVTAGSLYASNTSGLVKTGSILGPAVNWTPQTDHTGDLYGLMWTVNMPDNIGVVVAEYVLTDLCPNTTLEFSAWLLNLTRSTAAVVVNGTAQSPNVILRIIDPATSTVIANYVSGDIPFDEEWHRHSVIFSNGGGTTILLQIINNTQGSNRGNDLAIDDIMVRPCVPDLKIIPGNDTLLCDIDSILLSADITPGIYTPPVYEWMYRNDQSSVWQMGPVGGAASAWNFSPGKGVWWVRYRVYPAGLSATGNCTAISDSVKITFGEYPVIDLGADLVLCADSVVLSVTDGAVWEWNTGSTDSFIVVRSSGDFSVEVSDSFGCIVHDSIDVELADMLHVDLGPDLGICDKDLPVVLTSSQDAGTHYLWSTGLSDTTITVTRSDVYWLQVERDGCTGSDTVAITVVRTPVFNIGNDSTICEQSPLRIGAVVAGGAYSWNTGETTPYIHVSKTGDYILSVDVDGCIVHDTIGIVAMLPPDIDLGQDDDICLQQTIVVDAGIGGNNAYEWSTGETTSSISVTSAGTYSVTVTTEYQCVGSDTIVFSFYPDPVVHLGSDTTVCEETPLRLSAWALNADSLIWSDGSAGESLFVRYGGDYIVTAVNKCGAASDTITLSQVFCDIWLPNAFTPNGDGVNDVFRILGNLSRLKGVTLSVYNRWGERVFVTNDKLEGWDGYHKGIAVQMGTYVYLLQYSLDGRPYTLNGNFHLLR